MVFDKVIYIYIYIYIYVCVYVYMYVCISEFSNYDFKGMSKASMSNSPSLYQDLTKS